MMVEILVRVKSVPAVSDNVAQSMSSLPVTVKLIGADDDVAAERASVTVGGVVSGSVVVVVDGASCCTCRLHRIGDRTITRR